MSVTAIQWTDRVWNPVTGCTKVSAGCKHCYAETIAGRFWATQYPDVEVETGGPQGTETRSRRFTDVLEHPDRLGEPFRWKKPSRVFVNSMSDLFHEDVSDQFISLIFAVMALAPQHTFQILTKRAARMRNYLTEMAADPDAYCFAWADNMEGAPHRTQTTWPLPNVWLGVSVENQDRADERIPVLLQTPAATRFISAEPLLGPIDLWGAKYQVTPGTFNGAVSAWKPSLDWVIVGGESGPGARPCDLAWVQFIVTQCRAAGVACFVKQLGGVPMISHADWASAESVRLLNARNARRVPDGWEPLKLNDRKGGDMQEWPSDLRIREFPADPIGGARGVLSTRGED